MHPIAEYRSLFGKVIRVKAHPLAKLPFGEFTFKGLNLLRKGFLAIFFFYR